MPKFFYKNFMKRLFLTIIPTILFFILCSATAFYLYSCQKYHAPGTVEPSPPTMGTFLLDIALLESPLMPIPSEYLDAASNCFQKSIFFEQANNCSGAQNPLCVGAVEKPKFNVPTSSVHADEVVLRVVIKAPNPAMEITTHYLSSDIVNVDNNHYVVVSAPTTQTSSIDVTLFDKCCKDKRILWGSTVLESIISSDLVTVNGTNATMKKKHMNLFVHGQSATCTVE